MENNNMISIQVNEKNLIKNIGQTFSGSSTVISELMQNARRAKATEVRFYTEAESEDLVVIDNGEGVKDFSKLLHVADSGWDEATKKEDKPFGMGFLSCLFAAEIVIVESNGQRTIIDTQKAINQEAVLVESTGNTTPGTKITLKNFKSPEGIEKLLGKHLSILAAGFPIGVFWNELEIKRQFAVNVLENLHEVDGVLVSLGADFFSNLHFKSYSAHTIFAYLQGLPIYCSNDFGKKIPSTNDVVLHLLSDEFIPRMPDRDKLFDEALHEKTFKKIINGVVRNELLKLKASVSPEEMMKYWYLAKTYKCNDIFNDIPILPAQVLSIPFATPIQLQDFHGNERNLEECSRNVTRAEIESGEVKLVGYENFDCDEHTGAPWVLGNALGWLNVSEALHSGHWANKYISLFNHHHDPDSDASELKVIIEPAGAIIAIEEMKSGWVHNVSKIVVCDHYIVKTTDGLYSAEISDSATSGYVNDELCLVVPKGDVYPGYIIEQIADFQGEHDFYESDRDEEESHLNTLVTALRGGKPEDTLRQVVLDGCISKYPTLHGKTFVISISETGEISLIAQELGN